MHSNSATVHHDAISPSHPEVADGAVTRTATALVSEILATAGALRAARADAVPVVFWDFDGTVIEGDCSEGLKTEDGRGFAGLVEVAMARGHSARFTAPHGVAELAAEVQRLIEREGYEAANGAIVGAFAGAKLDALLTLAREHFAAVMNAWLFAEAVEMWRLLEAADVRSFVLSASADFFVKGAARALGVNEDRLHGIRLATAPDGTLAREVLAPLTYAEGKAARMRELLAELAARESQSSFWPVAALGNSLRTDGPLLEAVARTVLPAGRPVSILINASAPPAWRGIFREAIFRGRPAALVA
jgi:phosphoserine phosphatase